MPPNEAEHVQAIRNRIRERRRALEARHRQELERMRQETKQLDEWERTLGDLVNILPNLLTGETLPDESSETNAPQARIPITELIDRYFAESGAVETTAAVIKNYIAAQGYAVTNATYSSVHEALRRRVERGELVKEGPKFRRKGEGE